MVESVPVMPPEQASLSTSKVLVVGAGGIGCELLKNLVLSNFLNIEVVDMDTIELSNLNRQFLFRRRHIGKFKSEIAAEAVMVMNSKAKVVAHVGNIMDADKFPLSWFMQFKIVLNALDNINARRYVNGICLALNVPLVESGTAGYLGQCTVILPRKSECYDCTAKEAPKTFAVCTIRSTPSALIHCVVWAKDYLLSNLFGESQDQEVTGEIEDDEHLASLRKETEAFKTFRELARNGDDSFASEVFKKVFNDDIECIRKIEALWESRPAPSSLPLKSLSLDESLNFSSLNDQKIWDLNEWAALFLDSARRLRDRAFEDSTAQVFISFDKDDQDTLDFVASVANLRAHIYGIALASRFELKAIAGNIIPAIATTNAIAAGMVTLQARKILSGRSDECVELFITSDPSRKNFFVRSKYFPPSTECTTCFVHRATLRCDTGKFTLGNIIEMALPMFIKKIDDSSVSCEALSVLQGSRLIYDEEDMPSSASKTLKDLGAGDSKFLRFEFLEGIPLVMAIIHDESFAQDEFGVTFDLIPKDQVLLGAKRGHEQVEDDDSDGLEIVDPDSEESGFEIIEPPTTRQRTSD